MRQKRSHAGAEDRQSAVVHISAVEQASLRGLDENQKVSYEIRRDRRSGKESAGRLKTVE